MEPTATALLVLVIAESAMLGVLLRLYLHARQLNQQHARQAPAPAPAQPIPAPTPVDDLEVRERWEALDLSSLHELNREEVEKLLAQVRGSGVRSLTAAERAFLDRIARAVQPS